MHTPKPLGIAALLLTGLALAACGNSGSNASSNSSLTPAPSASASASTSPSDGPGTASSPPAVTGKPTVCGKIQMKGNEESVVRVKGTLPCDSLLAIINAYDKAAKQGLNGEAVVKGWKCKTASPVETQKHGYITICTRDGDEFVTKLH